MQLDAFDLAEQKRIRCDSDGEEDRCQPERSFEGVGDRNHVAGDDGRGDGGDLAEEVHDAADTADTTAWGDEPGDGPSDGRGCR